MDGKISSSIMCSSFRKLEEELRLLEELRIEYIHVDIMDGHFVPNFTLGPDFVRAVRSMTSLPMDIHLMVENPESWIGPFKPREGDIVTIHQEATVHLQRALSMIRDTGARAGVALNPATPLCTIEHVLDDVDLVLIMTVNPGYAGQKLVPATLKKITETCVLARNSGRNAEIEVDGNVSFENAEKMRRAGADIFVAGTSSLYHRELGIGEAAARLRKAISVPKEIHC